jgi:hypothetical protein
MLWCCGNQGKKRCVAEMMELEFDEPTRDRLDDFEDDPEDVPDDEDDQFDFLDEN